MFIIYQNISESIKIPGSYNTINDAEIDIKKLARGIINSDPTDVNPRSTNSLSADFVWTYSNYTADFYKRREVVSRGIIYNTTTHVYEKFGEMHIYECPAPKASLHESLLCLINTPSTPPVNVYERKNWLENEIHELETLMKAGLATISEKLEKITVSTDTADTTVDSSADTTVDSSANTTADSTANLSTSECIIPSKATNPMDIPIRGVDPNINRTMPATHLICETLDRRMKKSEKTKKYKNFRAKYDREGMYDE